ncbi:MAG: ShlB/FhaC/HecB family hemolysin secretion/activation protein [Proteobacteria bacterium]|nr:ShlB/FhaC/HecB family hemolysin secretion/activation protein [Pseudomonadota bacterium]
MLAPGLAWGQAAPSRAELDPAARARPPRLGGQPDLLTSPGEGPCPLAENPAPLTIRSVTFHGLRSVPAERLAGAYADLVGKAGDASDLCKIRDRAAEALFDMGVLARVEIPAQTINAGAVTLEVIEAHIVNVVVRGDAGGAAPLLERYAKKLRGMTPFDIDKVQRYVLLASDIPGLKVQASVRPNLSGERGAVDLDLNVTRDDGDLILNAQNLQSKATGRWGALARYDWNARTEYGERTSIVGYHTLNDEQWVVQALEDIHLGDEGWTVHGAFAYGQSRPGDTLKALGLESRSLVATVEADFPLVRRRRENLSLGAGLEVVDQDTKLGGGGTLIHDKLQKLYVKAEGDKTLYWDGKPVLLRGLSVLRTGVEGPGASRGGDTDLSRAEGRPGGWSLYGEGSAVVYLAPQLFLRAQVDAQYAPKPLLAYDEYAVGSLTIGRGYDPAYVSGDSAVAASLELHAGPYQPKAGWAVSPYVFYDVGHVSNHDTGSRDETLASTGIGFQAPLRDRWVIDVNYAKPLDKRLIDRARPPGRFLINLTARFF